MRRRHHDERGQALAIVLALVTLLFLVGTTLAAQASTALRTTAANRGQGGDFYAADGAAELAIWWQRNGRAGNPPALTLNGLTASGTVAVAPPTPAGPGWPMWGFNGQSWSSSSSPGPAAYALRWPAPPVLAQGSTIATASVADDGYIYVGATDALYAYRPDGTVAWSYATTSLSPRLGNFIGSPALTMRSGQRLIVAATDGTGSRQSAVLGLLENVAHTAVSLAWSYSLGNGANVGFVGGIRLDATGTRVYLAAENGNVYAFATTGSGSVTPLWVAAAGGELLVAAALSDIGTRLYAATSDGILTAIDAASGTIAWSRTVASGRALTAPVFARVAGRAHVYLATAGARTAVAIADTGATSAQDWSVALSNNGVSTPTFRIAGSQAFLYVADNAGNLRKVEDLGTSSAVRWIYRPDTSAIHSSLASDAAGDVYFGNQAGDLYRIHDNGASGATVWTGSPGQGAVSGGLVVGAFADLYAVTAGDNLLALGAALPGGLVTVTGAAGNSTVTSTYTNVGAGVPTLGSWLVSR